MNKLTMAVERVGAVVVPPVLALVEALRVLALPVLLVALAGQLLVLLARAGVFLP